MRNTYSGFLAAVADKLGITMEDAYEEIEAMIRSGIASPNPSVREALQRVPHKGAEPTPAEFIEHLLQRIPANGR